MRTLELDEYNYVYGSGCGVCYYYTSDNGWVPAGKWWDEVIGGRLYDFCAICNAKLEPYHVSCTRLGSC